MQFTENKIVKKHVHHVNTTEGMVKFKLERLAHTHSHVVLTHPHRSELDTAEENLSYRVFALTHFGFG